MNIKKFASVPKLIEITLDDESLLEKYGEPITFFTYDFIPLETYFSFYDAKSNNEFASMNKLMRNMILDQKGQKVLADDEDLPLDIAAGCINKLGELLGKSMSKTST